MKTTPLVSWKRNHSVALETTTGKKMLQRASLLHAQYAMESVMNSMLGKPNQILIMELLVQCKESATW
jgi:hypothetical protein